MLLPLFDKDCDLVAWIKPNEHIFGANMEWVAFISNGHAWSSKSGNWLGPVSGLLCKDTSGKPVLWNPKERVTGTEKPAKPAKAAKAAKPVKPARPATPAGGWSSESYFAWSGK